MCRLYTLSPDGSFSMTVLLKSKNVLWYDVKWLKTSVCFSGETRFEHRCINFDRTLELNCSAASMRLKSDKQTGRFSVLESQIPSESSELWYLWLISLSLLKELFTLAWRSLIFGLWFSSFSNKRNKNKLIALTNVCDVSLRRTTDLYLCQPSTTGRIIKIHTNQHSGLLLLKFSHHASVLR